MSIKKAISILDKAVPTPSQGLPEELFEYISRTTPLINVDLLIKNPLNQTLLSWRDDKYAKHGWHIPGRIVRFKETLETAIKKASELEIGTIVSFNSNPIFTSQTILQEYTTRGHCISFLYSCQVPSDFIPDNKDLTTTTPGYLKWFDSCPNNLLSFHEIYRRFI